MPIKRQFGRIQLLDDRDRSYPVRPLLARRRPSRRYRYWNDSGWWGDQRSTPHCVAYAWLHWLHDGPVTQGDKKPVLVPRTLYRDCQLHDDIPGTNYEGTTVRGGAAVLLKAGFVAEYRWARTADEVARTIIELGPMVLGTDWYSGMSWPKSDGTMTLSGGIDGGHAYLVNGVNLDSQRFRIKNSWGRSWGRDGRGWLGFKEVDSLLQDGEACIAIEIPRKRRK